MPHKRTDRNHREIHAKIWIPILIVLLNALLPSCVDKKIDARSENAQTDIIKSNSRFIYLTFGQETVWIYLSDSLTENKPTSK